MRCDWPGPAGPKGIAVAAQDAVGMRATGVSSSGWPHGWPLRTAGKLRRSRAAARRGRTRSASTRLLAEHREAWARRWADAEVVIEGDPEAELAARFSVFHLLICCRRRR